MSFVPKTQPYSGKIHAVTLGTGDKAIVIGGQNVLPFYTFDAAIENAPKIGIEVSDAAAAWDLPGLTELYAGCTTMAERAQKAHAQSTIVIPQKGCHHQGESNRGTNRGQTQRFLLFKAVNQPSHRSHQKHGSYEAEYTERFENAKRK